MNARRIQIVGALFLTVLSVPSLCGQSSRSDPWLDFPSYDQTLVWYLRRGADAKEVKRRLAQHSASVDTFRRLIVAERRDDALVELKRILEAPDGAQTIAALRALNEAIHIFQIDQTLSYNETIRQTIASARARIAQLPREDAARLAREMLPIDQWWEGQQASQKWPERLKQFVRDYDGTEAALLTQVDLLMSDPSQILKQIGDLSLFIAGFFSESLNRKMVDVDYYATIGGRAYHALSRVETDTFSPVFAELGSKFVDFVDVLSEVSERTSCATNVDLLRLYEKWIKTGSRRSGQLLVERGVVPNASIKATLQ